MHSATNRCFLDCSRPRELPHTGTYDPDKDRIVIHIGINVPKFHVTVIPFSNRSDDLRLNKKLKSLIIKSESSLLRSEILKGRFYIGENIIQGSYYRSIRIRNIRFRSIEIFFSPLWCSFNPFGRSVKFPRYE